MKRKRFEQFVQFVFKKKTAICVRFKFCVQTHRILRKFPSNSACKPS